MKNLFINRWWNKRGWFSKPTIDWPHRTKWQFNLPQGKNLNRHIILQKWINMCTLTYIFKKEYIVSFSSHIRITPSASRGHYILVLVHFCTHILTYTQRGLSSYSSSYLGVKSPNMERHRWKDKYKTREVSENRRWSKTIFFLNEDYSTFNISILF